LKRYVDYIRDIIIVFSDDDVKEFKNFLQRQRSKKERMDLKLFELLRKDENLKPSEICTKLYGNSKNMNAYHSVRKRLLKQLMEFVVLKRMEEDTTSASSIMGLLSVSHFLFDNNMSDTAWFYLMKCEEIALRNEQYDLLDNVYNAQIEHANDENAPPVEGIIQNWKKNKDLADQDERANVAKMLIKINLDKKIKEDESIDINKEINDVLEEYQLNDVVFERPRLLYNFLSIIRSSVLTTKDYVSFQPIVMDLYHEMERKGLFQKKDHFYKLSIEYMICHVLYRSRKFKSCLEYLEIFKTGILAYNKSHYQLFWSKYVLIYAAAKSYDGDHNTSVAILTEELNNTKKQESPTALDMRLNLAVYQFQQENYSATISTMLDFEHSDSWYAKKMGKEWVMRKNLIDLLTQYEKGNTEIAMNRMATFKKNHKSMLKSPMYKRIRTFLGFVQDCIDKPYWVATKEYYEYVDNTLERWPVEREDLQAMAFYCWLKSKMAKKSYYYILVETVNGRLTDE
jgi:hypothetical protein